MPVAVRRAAKSDAPALAQFAMKLVEQHRAYDPVRFARLGDFTGMARFYGGETEAKNAIVLIAELNERPVGFAYLSYETVSYMDLARSIARLHDIYVDETARHEGVGKALIAAAVDAARSFGASKVLLSVAAANSEAQDFFDGSGFRTTMLEKMLVLDGEGEV